MRTYRFKQLLVENMIKLIHFGMHCIVVFIVRFFISAEKPGKLLFHWHVTLKWLFVLLQRWHFKWLCRPDVFHKSVLPLLNFVILYAVKKVEYFSLFHIFFTLNINDNIIENWKWKAAFIHVFHTLYLLMTHGNGLVESKLALIHEDHRFYNAR